jgi:hypothetical protein
VVERVVESAAPIVVMTPMMPQDHARLSKAMPGRVVAAMPGLLAYESIPSTIRYWLPRVATTMIGTSSSSENPERQLVARLESAGMRATLERDVLARNVATIVSFIPLAMALDAAGGIDAALADDALLAMALEATGEGRELGRTFGKAEGWASMLLRFVRPLLLKLGVALARSRAPEAVSYVEHQFGTKLHAQNVLMAHRIIELAKEKGTPWAALDRLLERDNHAAGVRPIPAMTSLARDPDPLSHPAVRLRQG